MHLVDVQNKKENTVAVLSFFKRTRSDSYLLSEQSGAPETLKSPLQGAAKAPEAPDTSNIVARIAIFISLLRILSKALAAPFPGSAF